MNDHARTRLEEEEKNLRIQTLRLSLPRCARHEFIFKKKKTTETTNASNHARQPFKREKTRSKIRVLIQNYNNISAFIGIERVVFFENKIHYVLKVFIV